MTRLPAPKASDFEYLEGKQGPFSLSDFGDALRESIMRAYCQGRVRGYELMCFVFREREVSPDESVYVGNRPGEPAIWWVGGGAVTETRLILGDKVYRAESVNADVYVATHVIGEVRPTREEVEAMAMGRRVTKAIRDEAKASA